MLRNVLLIALVAMLAIMPVSAQDAPTGELVISLSNDPTSLFPPRGADITAGNAADPLYDTLVDYDENNNLVPELAESWEISEDGTVYTFTLRQGVTFHNGEPFTAEAVVATWETGSDSSNDYASTYTVATSVEVIDDFTVQITTDGPMPLFLNDLAGWGIVPPAYIREVGIDAFEQNPVGSGPFRFVERIAGDRIVYEANPEYWRDDAPRVAGITFRIIPDLTTRLAAIQTGEIQIANRLTVDDAATLEGVPNVTVISYPNDRVYYVAFKNIGNGVDTPIIDQRVRQALNYAVNRDGMVNALFGGAANTISGFVVGSNLGYNADIQPYPYDPEMARTLLTEAGYPEGFAISMGCPADAYTNINEVCLAIQRDLAAVGIDLTIEFKTSNSFWSEAGYGAVGPMYVDSWSSGVGEALPRLQGALIPGNYYNTWEDETIVDLISQIETTVDRDARAALYGEIQQVMFDNPPFIYLYQLSIYEAIASNVEGYMPRANEGYDLTFVSLGG
ncbi:MAG: ABC transporter substrate-binding protein [Chloroflexota bacterium]|nr:ABC transporter substrate-binding protein [Chloroflexota bacterium]